MNEAVYHQNFQIEDTHFWFQARQKIISVLIRDMTNLTYGDEVLDIGCGTGGFSEKLQEKFKVACLDMDETALQYCRKRGLNDLNQGYLHDFNADGRNIKAVFMLDVLEHIKEDQETVNEVYELLKSDGYFVTTVPAYQWMWSKHDEIHMHYRRYTINQFSELFVKAGFEVEYKSYFNTFLFPVALLKRVADKLTGNQQEKPVQKLPKPLNWVFEKAFSAEKYFLPHISFPFGLSIVLIARKP